MRFNPTTYFRRVEETFALAEKFLELDPDEPQLLYIWGHTYELDESGGISWEQFETLCQMLAGKADIFYGTNAEVLLNE